MAGDVRREWLPDSAAALAVGFVGLFQATVGYRGPAAEMVPLTMVALGLGIAVGLVRRAPAVALGVACALTLLQVVTGLPALVTNLAIGVVLFGAARWGSRPLVWLGALAIPVGATGCIEVLAGIVRQVTPDTYDMLGTTLQSFVGYWRPVLVLIGTAVLAVPWLVGLVLRVSARARVDADLAAADVARAAADREQAKQLAQVRENQARLARDVHDVVGHSLAAILAQAESGQYLLDEDPAALKRTMATIADSARTSLQNVRQVLSATREPATASTPGLDSLVEGLRTSGHEVVATRLGTPRPLPPELEMTAFRVLQEMTTNAMKHGRRDRPVTVRQHWSDSNNEAALRITVENIAKCPPQSPKLQAPTGQGLFGMRERLESVSGRLDVCQRDVAGERTFTVTAWIPVAPRP